VKLTDVDRQVRARLESASISTEYIVSPNHNLRPEGAPIDTVVIHFTALPMRESIAHLTSVEKQVSTHYIIGRDGALVQLVPLERRSWHSGVSELYGRPDVNSSSVGIDLVFVPGTDLGYTERQYEVLAELGRALMEGLPIVPGRLVGHEHVALPMGRKQDPGPSFDWSRFCKDMGVDELPAVVRQASQAAPSNY
jgi:N-acetylmuramoyl-L-alanine amidase